MNIDQIIGRLMGDDSQGEERSALEAWKKEAEENVKALEEIKKIASLSDTLKDYEDFDSENAWESFASTMEEELDVDVSGASKKDKNTRFFSLKRLSQIAAIFVITIGSFFVVNQFLNTEEGPTIYSAVTEMTDVNLDDGTQVILDKSASLTATGDRSVEFSGRAYFEVESSENNPFTIDLPLGKVTVLGTEFTIDTDGNSTEVYVEEGTVRYEMANRTWTLVGGQLIRVNSNGEGTVLEGRDDNYNSWKNQKLIFRDNNMQEVVAALSRHFKKDVLIENKKAFTNCNVMNIFTNSSLEDILNGLRETHGLKFEIREDKYYIVSAKC